MESSQQHDDALTLSSRLKRLPRNTRRLLSHINFTSDEDTLWKACQRKQILTIASDGGLKGRKGTFGWSVTTPKNDILCEGAGPIDGPYDTASSTRCELGGYAAALLFLSLLHRHWGHRHKCTFRWVTDSQTAINNVVRETRASSTKTRQPANSDYLGVIRSETKSLRRKITTKWIKGHQTVRSDVCNGHTRDVIRNNHVDSLATWYREQSNKRQSIEKTDHTPEARVTVLLNGVRLVSQVESSIRFHINGYHLRLHIQSQNRWSNATWNRIDVEALGRFYRRLPPAAQVAQTKFMFNQWHTGVTRIRNAKVKDLQLRLCPCCKTMDETTQHVLQCRSNSDHEKGLQVFRKTLSPKEPHPVFHILRDGIISWVEGIAVYDPPFDQIPSKFHERLRVALSDQLTIGWDNAVKGYLSVEWRFMAEEAMFDSSPAKPDTGYYRIQNILKAVHVLTQTTWKARNNMLHDNQDTINRHIREAEAAEITAMHRQSETLRAGDRHYCEQPLERF
ncbi:hypothetical protein MHU86_9408 [Fragilaria crotonensis]|nr:hypothetical protein MHU86_9408 [Fragilaria crotonensis]